MRTTRAGFNPDSPDEMAFGQLRAPITIVKSNSYAGSSGRISTDPTGERRNRQFRQRFRGLRSCRANPSGESGLKQLRFGRREFPARTLSVADLNQLTASGQVIGNVREARNDIS